MKYLFPIFSLFLGLTIGLFIARTPNSQSFSETRSSGNYKFINPLLDCDTANFSQDNNLSRLKSDISLLINNRIGNNHISYASVYFRDLNNGPWIGINEKELFSPSSLVKVPLMIAYYKTAESNPDLLKKELETSKVDDLSNQNIKPESTLVPNQKYTVEELINHMIIYSDNLAYEILNSHIDPKTLIDVYHDLGVDISLGFADPSGNIISVKAYASFFRILFNSSYLDKNMSEKALELLSRSTYTRGLVAGLPPNITVSHKFGERQYLDTHQKQLHDCGIVYLPQKPYLLCIMTRGQDFNDLASTIKDISSLVFRNLFIQN